MKRKAFAPTVILSALACVCIPAPLCEPVSAPGGHLSSHLPQGSLLVDTGPLTSPHHQQRLLTKCIPPCGQASGAWPDLSTPENTSLASKPRFWDCSCLSLPLEQEFCLQEQPLPPVEHRAVTNESHLTATVPAKTSKRFLPSILWRQTQVRTAPPPLRSLTSQRHLQTVTSAAKQSRTLNKDGKTSPSCCRANPQHRMAIELGSPEHLTHTHTHTLTLLQPPPPPRPRPPCPSAPAP